MQISAVSASHKYGAYISVFQPVQTIASNPGKPSPILRGACLLQEEVGEEEEELRVGSYRVPIQPTVARNKMAGCV